MPDKQASKTVELTDDELLDEVLHCGHGDTWTGLARRLGYKPTSLAKRLTAMGRKDVVDQLAPLSLDPAARRAKRVAA